MTPKWRDPRYYVLLAWLPVWAAMRLTKDSSSDLLTDALAALAAVLLARKRSPAELGAAVAALRDNGMDALAQVIIGRLPFDNGPDYEALTQ